MPVRQPTMADIARMAGVSRVAVSYALNGRPGVSGELRDRILRIAREVGFNANGPARAMRGTLTRTVGLTLRRPSDVFHVEVFRRELISGVQAELMARNMGLTLQFVDDAADEIEVYRRWAAERRVGGVLLCDIEIDDPRIAAVSEVDLPAVVVGGPDARLSSVYCGEAAAVGECVAYLAGLGHQRIARVSGPPMLLHTGERDEAFRRACADAGVEGTIVAADYTGDGGAKATRRLLSSRTRPSAVAYDNDIMAIAGLAVAQEMGLGVPADLSIIAWEDSPLCAVVRPSLTVMRRDIARFGARAAMLLLDAIAGEPPVAVLDQTAELVVRDSTGPKR